MLILCGMYSFVKAVHMQDIGLITTHIGVSCTTYSCGTGYPQILFVVLFYPSDHSPTSILLYKHGIVSLLIFTERRITEIGYRGLSQQSLWNWSHSWKLFLCMKASGEGCVASGKWKEHFEVVFLFFFWVSLPTCDQSAHKWFPPCITEYEIVWYQRRGRAPGTHWRTSG